MNDSTVNAAINPKTKKLQCAHYKKKKKKIAFGTPNPRLEIT